MQNSESNRGKRRRPVYWAGGVLIFALTACSRQQPPAPTGPDGAPQDYRQMLDRVHQRNAYENSLETVKQAVQKFQVDLGRLPTNLYELIRYRYLEKLPEAVPPGQNYGYDALRGQVNFMKLSDDQAATTAAP